VVYCSAGGCLYSLPNRVSIRRSFASGCRCGSHLMTGSTSSHISADTRSATTTTSSLCCQDDCFPPQIKMSAPASYYRTVSPPPLRRRQRDQSRPPSPKPAEVEAGRATIQDHAEYWFSQLSLRADGRVPPSSSPHLISVEDLKKLYYQHENETGCLFVVHQHTHPLAGLHYDLRLQFSHDSALSFSVPYGLPGNPNSVKKGRLAVETRVHCLWNHLVESASPGTGSLLIWDIGHYSILPRGRKKNENDGYQSDSDQDSEAPTQTAEIQMPVDEPKKLREAFQKVGSRLVPSYILIYAIYSVLSFPDHYLIKTGALFQTPPPWITSTQRLHHHLEAIQQ
jgi:hypothetical protein